MSRTVLVTGGSRGIGKGIAQAFLEAGERVVIADLGGGADWNYALGSSAQMAEAIEDLRAFGEVDSTPLDVTDADACAAAVAFARERFGGLDVLVNNAGVVDSGPRRELPGGELGPHLRREREGHLSDDAGGSAGTARVRRCRSGEHRVHCRQARLPQHVRLLCVEVRGGGLHANRWRTSSRPTASASTPSAPASSTPPCGTTI